MRKLTEEEYDILYGEYNRIKYTTYHTSEGDYFGYNFDRWLICMSDEAIEKILREHNNPYYQEDHVYQGE